MYEAVTAFPGGHSTISRFASVAGQYGYDGIVVRNTPSAVGDPDAVSEETATDVVDGIELDGDSIGELRGRIDTARAKSTVLCVRGGSSSRNRFVAEREQVDVLTRPLAAGKQVNHVTVKTAKEAGVHLEINLRPVLFDTGGRRVRAIDALSHLVDLIDHYDAPYVVSGRPASHLEVRSGRELAAVGEVIGVGGEWLEAGLTTWGEIAARNASIASDTYIEPGVERRNGR